MSATVASPEPRAAAAAAAHRQVLAAIAAGQASLAFAMLLRPWHRLDILDTASKMLTATLEHVDSIGFDEDGDELTGVELDAYASAQRLALELSNAASSARSQPPPLRRV